MTEVPQNHSEPFVWLKEVCSTCRRQLEVKTLLQGVAVTKEAGGSMHTTITRSLTDVEPGKTAYTSVGPGQLVRRPSGWNLGWQRVGDNGVYFLLYLIQMCSIYEVYIKSKYASSSTEERKNVR